MINSLIFIFVILLSIWSFAEDKTPYQILGVPQNASAKQIKSAYRKLAMKHHPDRTSDPMLSQKFIEINQAYKSLLNKSEQPIDTTPRKTDLGGGFGMAEVFEKDMAFDMLKSEYPIFFSENFLFENKESYSRIGSLLRANKKLAYQAILSSHMMTRKDTQSALIAHRTNMMDELKFLQSSMIKDAPVRRADVEADSYLLEIALSQKGYEHANAFNILLYLNKPQVSDALDYYIDFLVKTEFEKYYAQTMSINRALQNNDYQHLTLDKVLSALKRSDITQVGLNELIGTFNHLDNEILTKFKNQLIEILPTLDIQPLRGNEKKQELWKKILELSKNDVERKIVLEKMLTDRNEFNDYQKVEFSNQILKISSNSKLARDTLLQIQKKLVGSNNYLMRSISLHAGSILLALDPKYAYLLDTLLSYPLDSYTGRVLGTLLSLYPKNKKLHQIIKDNILNEAKKYSKGSYSARLSVYLLKELQNKPLPKSLLDVMEVNIGRIKDLSAGDENEINTELLSKARRIQIQEDLTPTCSSLFR